MRGNEMFERFLGSAKIYQRWSRRLNRSKMDVLWDLLMPLPSDRVLDLGCGPATSSAAFEGCNYTGVDINEDYIRAARELFPAGTFIVADVVSQSTKLAIYDLVLINSLLHHLDDHHVDAVLSRAWNALAPGGRVIVNEPLLASPTAPHRFLLMRLDRGRYFRTREDWLRLFGERFKVTSSRRYELDVVPGIVGWTLFAARLVKSEH